MSLSAASRLLAAAVRSVPFAPARPFAPRASLATIAWASPPDASASSTPTATGAQSAAAASPSPRSHHAVVSIAGQERPGIVQAATTAMAARGANVEESRMAVLGGDFAMIVYVSLPEAAEDGLAAALRDELPAFSVSVRETKPAPEADATAGSESAAAASSRWDLSLEGPDSPGIVAAVAEALATNGCNVHELDTETKSAPFAGYELFHLQGVVAVDESRLDELAVALEKVEAKYGSTIELTQQS